MSTEESAPVPVKEEATLVPVAEHEEAIQRAKDFYGTYGKHLTTVLAVVLVAVVASRLYNATQTRKAAEASTLFSTAQSVEDLESLAEKFKGVPSAPLARLRLAKAYYDAANYDQAITTYEALSIDSADALVGLAATMGVAHCLEARGQTEEALAAFEAFMVDNPDHFLRVQAVFGQVRTLDQQGRTADARAAIEDFISANQNSQWIPPAEELQETLTAKLTAARTPVVAPVVVPVVLPVPVPEAAPVPESIPEPVAQPEVAPEAEVATPVVDVEKPVVSE
jgi:predicted negative regulator of RcsB-dependent stress response